MFCLPQSMPCWRRRSPGSESRVIAPPALAGADLGGQRGAGSAQRRAELGARLARALVGARRPRPTASRASRRADASPGSAAGRRRPCRTGRRRTRWRLLGRADVRRPASPGDRGAGLAAAAGRRRSRRARPSRARRVRMRRVPCRGTRARRPPKAPVSAGWSLAFGVVPSPTGTSRHQLRVRVDHHVDGARLRRGSPAAGRRARRGGRRARSRCADLQPGGVGELHPGVAPAAGELRRRAEPFAVDAEPDAVDELQRLRPDAAHLAGDVPAVGVEACRPGSP